MGLLIRAGPGQSCVLLFGGIRMALLLQVWDEDRERDHAEEKVNDIIPIAKNSSITSSRF